ncbi:MAG: hypothetical protein MUO54_12065, partial [Anaerolineales bacterium]|nr:hypothetical protein [Anaerolineales bacterium]
SFLAPYMHSRNPQSSHFPPLLLTPAVCPLGNHSTKRATGSANCFVRRFVSSSSIINSIPQSAIPNRKSDIGSRRRARHGQQPSGGQAVGAGQYLVRKQFYVFLLIGSSKEL